MEFLPQVKYFPNLLDFLPSQNFFPLARIVFWYLHQHWCLVIKNLSSVCPLLKLNFWDLFSLRENPRSLHLLQCWDHSWFYHAPHGKTSPKTFFPPWGNQNILSHQVQPFQNFISFISCPKSFLSFVLNPRDLQSKYQDAFEFWPQTNSPG